jgi:hypothetical protein
MSSGLILSTIQPNSPLFEVGKYSQCLDEIRDIIVIRLREAAKKFTDYENSVKIVLLEFYGDIDDISDDTLRKIIQDVDLPDLIDEVWSVREEWISDSQTAPTYECLRRRQVASPL